MEKIKTAILSILTVVLLTVVVFSGAYEFGKRLNKDIEHKKEVDSLKIEQLKLEIELLKLQTTTDEQH